MKHTNNQPDVWVKCRVPFYMPYLSIIHYIFIIKLLYERDWGYNRDIKYQDYYWA